MRKKADAVSAHYFKTEPLHVQILRWRDAQSYANSVLVRLLRYLLSKVTRKVQD